MVLSSPY